MRGSQNKNVSLGKCTPGEMTRQKMLVESHEAYRSVGDWFGVLIGLAV